MRLVTFNLMSGRSLLDGQVDLARLGAAVASLDADVLALQEVDHDQSRSGGAELTAVVAEAVGAVAHRFAATIVGTPGARWRPVRHDADGVGEPRFGVSLVSRLPVREWHLLRLAPARIRSPVYVPGPRAGLIMIPDEPRAVLAAEIETPGGPVTVATTHLSFVPGWNALQLRRTVRWLRTLPAPRLLLGDLNLPAGLAAALSRWRPLARIPTFPSPRPRIQFDHVLLDRRGSDHVEPRGARTAEVLVSDHRPLLVDLDL